jgi:predicted DCC family thiol-disulfide oxidoreductase YuxK
VAEPRPTLVYDGDCGVCVRWVAYWKALTGDAVVYRPYQEAAADFPAIAPAAFRRAIRFIAPDGTVLSGAAATYKVLSYAPGKGFWWWLYRRVPGFAPVAEACYTWFARNRGLLDVLTRWLWGATLEPVRYDLVRAVFLRGIGAIYFAAFASLAVQVLGLVGSGGILPAEAFLSSAQRSFGAAAKVLLPTLFWIDASDTALFGGTIAGMLLAVLVVAGIAERLALAGLFVLYLGYAIVGQQFMAFQWDGLLLEAGFLAIFLPGRSRIVVWLYRWLVFRYLFMAGVAKLASGDPTWRDLTALSYHFGTQPLPSPLAWYAAHLPQAMLAFATAAALAIEVVLVFLIFTPRRLRAAFAWSVIGFQLLIIATGNFNFFNLLTILLCVFLFDDAALRQAIPARLAARVATPTAPPPRTQAVIATIIALIAVPAGANRIAQLFSPSGLPVAGVLMQAVEPLMIVNGYGLFASMTTQRPELAIEGSDDAQAWQEYVFRYKPGATGRTPTWNIPHQPRLDWQMWFAALGDPHQEWWFANFLARLLAGSPEVTSLLAANPFPDRPPRFVRAVLYEYRFTTPETRAATGAWWSREYVGEYVPAVSLTDFSTLK